MIHCTWMTTGFGKQCGTKIHRVKLHGGVYPPYVYRATNFLLREIIIATVVIVVDLFFKNKIQEFVYIQMCIDMVS